MWTSEEAKFDCWGVIELFGHQVLAGKVTQDLIGGCSFVRVDVPDSRESPGFTRYLGNGAIYSITICSEEAARRVQSYQGQRPIHLCVSPLDGE